jgi:16S rRNA (guanine527-N7)-methyltransferase
MVERADWDSDRELLAAGLTELALELAPKQADSLLALARLLHRWSRRTNLTGHRSLPAIVQRLILDAAALSTVLPRPSSLADLGSGAGFPGLPLAILWPGSRISLVESRERRHHFQKAACRELGLGNVHALRGRAEELDAVAHAVVVAQAMARPARAVEWMLRWAQPGGLLVIPGAEAAPEVPPHPHLDPEPPRSYRVPCGGPLRTVWLGRVRASSDRSR